jgi:hypothetical protein
MLYLIAMEQFIDGNAHVSTGKIVYRQKALFRPAAVIRREDPYVFDSGQG